MGIVVNNTDYTVLHAKDKNGHNATEITIQKNGKTAKIKIFAGSDNTYNAGDKIVIKGDNEITSANQNFVLNILKELNGKNNHGEFENKALKRPSSSTTFNPFSINPENIAEPKTFSDLMAELDGTAKSNRTDLFKNNKIKETLEKAKLDAAKIGFVIKMLTNNKLSNKIKEKAKELISQAYLNPDSEAGKKALEEAHKILLDAYKETIKLSDVEDQKVNTIKSSLKENANRINTDEKELEEDILQINKDNIIEIMDDTQYPHSDKGIAHECSYLCTSWHNDNEKELYSILTHLYAKLIERANDRGIIISEALKNDYREAISNVSDNSGNEALFNAVADAIMAIKEAISTAETNGTGFKVPEVL